eukprot:Pgem_evm2s4967
MGSGTLKAIPLNRWCYGDKPVIVLSNSMKSYEGVPDSVTFRSNVDVADLMQELETKNGSGIPLFLGDGKYKNVKLKLISTKQYHSGICTLKYE